MLPGSLVISNLQRISLSHTFKSFLIPSESVLNTEDGKWSCIHKECVETAKKANNFWTVSLFGNTLVLELWLFFKKKTHHISFWEHVFPKYERIKYSATQFSCELLEKNLRGEGGKACQELQVASCRHCFVVGKGQPLRASRPVVDSICIQLVRWPWASNFIFSLVHL